MPPAESEQEQEQVPWGYGNNPKTGPLDTFEPELAGGITKPKSEGESDQDCCDDAKNEFIKAMQRQIESRKPSVEELYEDDDDFQMMLRIKSLADSGDGSFGSQLFPEEAGGDGTQTVNEAIEAEFEKAQQNINTQANNNKKELAASVNSQDCGDFKVQMQMMSQGTAIPEKMQELIPIFQGIYKQWMDCEGTEWRGDSDDDAGSDDNFDAGSGIGISSGGFDEGFTDKYASSDSPIDTAWSVLKAGRWFSWL